MANQVDPRELPEIAHKVVREASARRDGAPLASHTERPPLEVEHRGHEGPSPAGTVELTGPGDVIAEALEALGLPGPDGPLRRVRVHHAETHALLLTLHATPWAGGCLRLEHGLREVPSPPPAPPTSSTGRAPRAPRAPRARTVEVAPNNRGKAWIDQRKDLWD